jgi:Domain of unknown function (DUF4351)
MPYMLSLERMAMERGLEEGRDRQVNLLLKQLNRKLGNLPDALITVIRTLTFTELESLGETIFDLGSVLQLSEHLVIAIDAQTQQTKVQPARLVQVVSAYLGDLSDELQTQIQALSIHQVRQLVTLLPDWPSQADLIAWLASQGVHN